jgi:DNA uptake protein ComE-like DNA-binding protein
VSRDTPYTAAFIVACFACVAAFNLAFPRAQVRVVSAPETGKPAYKIPVNTASDTELKAFFGLTKRKAAAIVKARSAAPLKSADDLAPVHELTAKDRARIAPFLTFEERVE